MRLFVVALIVLFAGAASAATLHIEVERHGFTGPIEVAVAPRVDGKPPEWSAPKTLAARKSSVSFDDLRAGLYAVLLSGPQPLQRLSAKANVGSEGSTLRLVIPRSSIALNATLAGEALPRAEIVLTHDQLRWHTELETDEDGRFAGELWEPGMYAAGVRHDRTAAPHNADVWLAPKAVTIDVPDRHVTGRILANGKPLGNAIVNLRSETAEETMTQRTQSAPDGRFAFFGVREGAMTLTARAPSYLDSDAVAFELRGAPARHAVDVELVRGEPRAVRVVDSHDAAIANAMLIASCDGHVKSTAVTNAEGRAQVALPSRGNSCAIYALPSEGSIAIAPIVDAQPLLIRVREGSSSLRLALKTDAGEVFAAMSLLLRIDGAVVPPAIARMIGNRGFPLVTNEEGSIALQRIPPGTYEFWPYRSAAEGQMLFETATEFDAPVSIRVTAGENNATVRFQAR